MLNGLDLFTGIGGITIALKEWVIPVAYCESEEYAIGVLLSRMQEGKLPVAPIWDDVRTLKGARFHGLVDIVYGGFPCQDISVAGTGKGLGESAAGYFSRSSGSLMKYDRNSSSWKTSLLFGQEAPTKLSENWPASGMTLGGSLYQLQRSGPTTNGNGGGFWPTPCGANNGGKNGKAKLKRMLWRTPLGTDGEKSGHGNLPHQVKFWPTPQNHNYTKPGKGTIERGGRQIALPTKVGGQLNPTWVEWLMGYQTGWTNLNASATQWFQSKRKKRSKD